LETTWLTRELFEILAENQNSLTDALHAQFAASNEQ
jgi:hypothetical protein